MFFYTQRPPVLLLPYLATESLDLEVCAWQGQYCSDSRYAHDK